MRTRKELGLILETEGQGHETWKYLYAYNALSFSWHQ